MSPFYFRRGNDSVTQIDRPSNNVLDEFHDNMMEMIMFRISDGGEAIIFSSDNKGVLIEGGGGHGNDDSDNNELLGQALQDYLSDNIKLKAIVLSHNHEDHMNAISSMIPDRKSEILARGARFYHHGIKRAGQFYTNLTHRLKILKIPITTLGTWEQISLEPWHRNQQITLFTGPETPSHRDPLYRSIMMNVTYGDAKFLFTGDVYTEYESALKKDPRTSNLLKADVLKITHHGSGGGTGYRFLKHVSPAFFVASTAKDEGHNLDPPTLDRIEKYVNQKQNFNLDYPFETLFDSEFDEGDIVVRTDGDSSRVLEDEQGILFEIEIENQKYHPRSTNNH